LDCLVDASFPFSAISVTSAQSASGFDFLSQPTML
jgi:hypothetical protein